MTPPPTGADPVLDQMVALNIEGCILEAAQPCERKLVTPLKVPPCLKL